jgi:hypothetical protein
MGIVIDGHMVLDQRRIEEHLGHQLEAGRGSRYLTIVCKECEQTLGEIDLNRKPLLPCGCRTQEGHDEGVRQQSSLRKAYGLTRSACVGCYLGDDAPSMHDCYIHRA